MPVAALIPLILLPPLLAAALLAIPATRRAGFILARLAPLPALIVALLANPGEGVELSWLLLSTPLGLDASGRVFLLFSALIWLAAGWQTGRGEHEGDARFMLHFMFAQTGNLGACIAQDGLGFYTFFALMTFAAYGLVVHTGTPDARRAGRVYLVLAVVGEVLVLLGLLSLAAGAGGALPVFSEPVPVSGIAALFILLGFGVKTGLPLLHFALPLAYAATPAAGAAVLAGAMIKAGLLGWLRFMPLGEAALPEIGQALMLAGVVAILLGSAIGLMQRQAAAVLAYSSIAQMGHLSLALGAGLMAPSLWPILLPAVILYATHHALIKASLLLSLDLVRPRASALGLTAWALAALSLAGAPFSGGMLAKAALKEGVVGLSPFWGNVLPGLLALGAFATALLMLRAWHLRRTGVADEAVDGGRVGPSLAQGGLLIAALVLPWGLASTTGADWVAALVPLLGAGVLAGLAARRGWRLPILPAGDLVVGLERLLRRATPPAGLPVPAAPEADTPPRRPPLLEARMRLWSNAGLVWLGVLLVMLAGVLILGG